MRHVSLTRSRIETLAVILALASAALPVAASSRQPTQQSTPSASQSSEPPRIQVALLLDTSSSMDGLIHQAREQLWSIVNTLADARRNGQAPTLEVALYEYGNSGLAQERGWIRRVQAFTSDLDLVSEALFSLKTNGGDEFCGQVIATAVADLQWSAAADTLKVVYIAGNEPFTQGPIDYREAIAAAKQRGIQVNAIHCGNRDESWEAGARYAGGDFFNIDDQQRVAHIAAPQDTQITELNSKLNATYVPFGKQGEAGKQRQLEQDANALASSPALLAKRARSKGSAVYKQKEWDLVDAYHENPALLESLSSDELPEELAELEPQARAEFLDSKRQERERIKTELEEQSRARESFVAEQRKTSADARADRSLGAALRQSLEDAAEAKNFELTQPEKPTQH